MLAATATANDRPETSRASHPLARPYLAALADLGLSDGQIARYFGMNQDDVAMLRGTYGIAEFSVPPSTPPARRRLFNRRRRA